MELNVYGTAKKFCNPYSFLEIHGFCELYENPLYAWILYLNQSKYVLVPFFSELFEALLYR